jgi:hypothetical protein
MKKYIVQRILTIPVPTDFKEWSKEYLTGKGEWTFDLNRAYRFKTQKDANWHITRIKHELKNFSVTLEVAPTQKPF